MKQKKTIWYARTYRKMHRDYKSAILYLLLIVLPCLLLLVFNVDFVTLKMSTLAYNVISNALPSTDLSIETSTFQPFKDIYILSYDHYLPSTREIAINLLVVGIVIVILTLTSIRGRPIMVYLLFSFMIHFMACVFCTFERDTVIYTGTQFSDLLVKQQISIWILFIVLMGLVMAFFSVKGLFYKNVAFFSLLLYSAVFGVIRYIVFIFILIRFSMLYMADMFFVTGPIFDFLYLVGIYSLYSSKMQKVFDSPAGEEEWRWL